MGFSINVEIFMQIKCYASGSTAYIYIDSEILWKYSSLVYWDLYHTNVSHD